MRYYWPSGEMNLAFPGLFMFWDIKLKVILEACHVQSQPALELENISLHPPVPSRITRDHMQMEQ